MVDDVFALDGVAFAVIGRRAQSTLDIFTEANIFLLNFIAEGHRALDACLIFFSRDIVEKPLEDRERFFVGERHDYVCRNVVGINVEHQVREKPKVESLLQDGARRVEALAGIFSFYGANRRELLRIVAEGIRAVLRVVDFLHQAGMGDGNVIALEIVVDVNFPIAIDDVITALGKLQTPELETLCLLGNLTDRKSTRLNSSHRCISYAVFCLKKKNKKHTELK